MTRGRDTRHWKAVRHQALMRDISKGAPCWICGQPIDYTVAPSSTDESWEPDHYYPIEDRPELAEEITNLRPSHRKCNRSRGKTMAVYGLGKSSRTWVNG